MKAHFLNKSSHFSKVNLTLLATAATSTLALAQGTKKSVLETYVMDGGPTMLLILAVFLILVALVVYNAMNVSRAKFHPDDLKTELMDHMTNCRVRTAIEISASDPSFLGRMLAFALPNVDATKPEDLGREGVEVAVADFTANEARKNMVWINYISLVAQSAPMVGLFGTVLGMVGAFATLAEAGQADPSQLASKISTALLTTLWGLIIAIPALVFYYMFKNKLNAFIAEATTTSEELVNASLQTINQDAYFAKIPEGLA